MALLSLYMAHIWPMHDLCMAQISVFFRRILKKKRQTNFSSFIKRVIIDETLYIKEGYYRVFRA